MDSDVRVIDVSRDTVPLDSSLGSLEPEVIELDSSCDMVANSCSDNGNPIYGMRGEGRVSPDDIEMIKTVNHSENREDSQSARSSDVAPQPVFKVMFRDQSVSRQYRQSVKEFLQTLVRTKPLCKKDTNESSLTLEIWDDEVDSKDEQVLVSTGNESTLNDSVQFEHDFLFTIDKRPNVKNDLDIPTYGQCCIRRTIIRICEDKEEEVLTLLSMAILRLHI